MFKELLDEDNSFSIDYRNLQVLATDIYEIYKVLSNNAPDIMDDIFQKKEIVCNIRNNVHFTERYINPFVPQCTLLYPLKISENR